MTKSELKEIIYECMYENGYISEALYESVSKNKQKLSKKDIISISVLVGLTGYALYDGIKNRIKYAKDKKERNQRKREEKQKEIERKNKEKYYATPEGKAKLEELKKEADEIGEKLGKEVEKKLREYDKKNLYKHYHNKNHNYDVCKDIKYDPINGYDVSITDYQDGIDYDYIYEFTKKHPNYKDDEKLKEEYESLYDNEWYYNLLDTGVTITKEIFDSMNHSKEIGMTVGSGDGDEGYVYIDVYVNK